MIYTHQTNRMAGLIFGLSSIGCGVTPDRRDAAVLDTYEEVVVPRPLVCPSISARGVQRISLATGGIECSSPLALGTSRRGTASADGRHIAFHSWCTNLVPDDRNRAWDIFLHDKEACTTRRVSMNPDGSEVDGDSNYPSLSPDARFVAYFSSFADSRRQGVYVNDTRSDQVSLVSRNNRGEEAEFTNFEFHWLPRGPIALNGGMILFWAPSFSISQDLTVSPNDAADLFLKRYPFNDQAELISRRSNLPSEITSSNSGWETDKPSISQDGRFTAFSLYNVRFSPTLPWHRHIFIHERGVTPIELVSVDNYGRPLSGDSGCPSISNDGRYVAFLNSGNLVMLRDRVTHSTRMVASALIVPDCIDETLSLSPSGRYLAYSASGTIIDLHPDPRTARSSTGSIGSLTIDRQPPSRAYRNRRLPTSIIDISFTQNDGFVVFSSAADNFVEGDHNGTTDVFIAPVESVFLPTPP